MDKGQKVTFSVVESKRVEIPEYTENTNTTTYVSWGTDNKFPDFINMLYNESATARACIDGISNFICGNGVDIKGGERWKNEINRRGDTVEDLLVAVSTDIMKFYGFAVQVIFNKLGVPVEFYALDFSRIRISADGKKVYYAKKWGGYTGKFEVFDAFNLDNVDPKTYTQVYVWRDPSSRKVYPTAYWRGCWRDCLSEISASKYVLNSLSNGMAVKSMVTIPNKTGLLTDDDKSKIQESLQTKFCGPDAENSFFLYFQEEGEDQLKVDMLHQEDDSDRFKTIRDSARENCFISFRVTPNLLGLPTATTGFNEQEFGEAFKLVQKTLVGPIQRKIERALKKLMGVEEINILPFNLETE